LRESRGSTLNCCDGVVPPAGLCRACPDLALGLRTPGFCGPGRNSVNGLGPAGTADFAAAIVCRRRERPPVAGLPRSWL